MTADDPYNLQRFLTAQEGQYHDALAELKRGRKTTHWIWFIFPQVAGLGSSPMAQQYAIQSAGEAAAYLQHPVLGSRLRECCEALLVHRGADIGVIMAFPDDLKLRSSMTLFAALNTDATSIFQKILHTFFQGVGDERTLDFVRSTA